MKAAALTGGLNWSAKVTSPNGPPLAGIIQFLMNDVHSKSHVSNFMLVLELHMSFFCMGQSKYEGRSGTC